MSPTHADTGFDPTARAYLIKGEDEALILEARDRLFDAMADQLNVPRSSFIEDMTPDPDEQDRLARAAEIAFACATPAFLTPRRVVLVRDAGKLNAESAQPLIDYLSEPLDTTVLVLAAGGGAVPVKLANAVKKVGVVIDASPPKPKDRAPFIQAHLDDTNLKASAAVVRHMADHLGEDVGRIGALVESLVSAYDDGHTLSIEDVDAFLGHSGGIPPWDLTDPIDAGHIDDALVQLHRMLEGGARHPLVVMATLSSHFVNMLRLDGSGARTEGDAAQLLGIAPFRAKKAMQQGARLGFDTVADAVELLHQADLDLKGVSELPDELILEVLVARLCRLSRSRPARAR